MAKAEKAFLAALAEDSELAEVRFNLALLRLRQKRYEDARQELGRVVESRPNMAGAWFYLGLAKALTGHSGEAVADYRRALEIDPSHTRAYLELGRALEKTGDVAEARRFLEHGLKVVGQPDALSRPLAHLPVARLPDR